MNNLEQLTQQVLAGGQISKEQAMSLWDEELKALCEAADKVRRQLCGDAFDLCTIINGKSGRCSENCKYCAQSASYPCHVDTYPLLETGELLEQARYNDEKGVGRYSVVTSGRRLSKDEMAQLCESYRTMHGSTGIALCASHGLLDEEDMRALAAAGVTRYHNNLETSRRFFPSICTTHTYDEKIATIKAAQKAGLTVCSGGIMGLGETREDRVDMALTLRELGITSVPLNLLVPIPGTPLEHNATVTPEEARRIVAVYRFVLPTAAVRLAGGRGLLPDAGRSLFAGGANAAITGDMLTTPGVGIETDKTMVRELGFEVRRHE